MTAKTEFHRNLLDRSSADRRLLPLRSHFLVRHARATPRAAYLPKNELANASNVSRTQSLFRLAHRTTKRGGSLLAARGSRLQRSSLSDIWIVTYRPRCCRALLAEVLLFGELVSIP